MVRVETTLHDGASFFPIALGDVAQAPPVGLAHFPSFLYILISPAMKVTVADQGNVLDISVSYRFRGVREVGVVGQTNEIVSTIRYRLD